jgi:hypothetical protein
MPVRANGANEGFIILIRVIRVKIEFSTRLPVKSILSWGLITDYGNGLNGLPLASGKSEAC